MLLVIGSVPAASAGAAGGPVPATLSCGTTTAIAYGTAPTKGSIPVAGDSACFTFTTAEGDVVWSDLANTSGDLSLFEDVYRPGGISTCAGPYSYPGYCDVPAGGSGTWTIEVTDSFGTGTGTFNISIQRLNTGVNCHAISFGKAAKSGKLKSPASSSCFSLSGAPGEMLFARAVGTTGTLGLPSMLVASPNGTLPCLYNEGGLEECPLTQSGTTTVLVYSTPGTTTGSFRIYSQDLTGLQHCTGLVAGAPGKAGKVAKAGDVACFTFAGTPGMTATVTLSSLTGTLQPLIDFFSPAGNSTCASPALSVSCAESTGTWSVLVDDDSATDDGTGTFTATLTAT